MLKMHDDEKPGRFSVKTLLIFAALLQLTWGLVPAASKLVIDEIPVEIYIALRWTLAGGLFALYGFTREKWRLRFTREGVQVALLGIAGYALASFGFLYGLKIGGVGNFALLCAFTPALTTGVAIVFLKERPAKYFYLSLGLAVTGVLFLIDGQARVASVQVAVSSAALIIAGGTLEALVFVFSKRKRKVFSMAKYLAIAQLAAAAFMWTAQLIWFRQFDSLVKLSSPGWGALIFVSLVACVLGYAVLYWLLRFLDGHRLALFDGLHMLSATAAGVFFFGDRLSASMLVGGLLLLSALTLANFQYVDN